MSIADALPRCFPLPRSIMVGDQTWAISTSAINMGTAGVVRLTVLLTGPYRRFRRARLVMDAERLLAGGYDAAAAAREIGHWLPHSDADDVLDIAGDGLALAPAAHFARPPDHQV